MILRNAILALISLDLVLAVILVQGVRHRPEASHSSAAVPTGGSVESTTAYSSPVEKPTGADLRHAPVKFTWPLLQSRNLKHYVANLRRVRCPPDTIHDIIVAEVNRRFARRERALGFRSEDSELWETPSSHPLAILVRQRKIRQLVREKQTLLTDVLGYEVPVEVPNFATRPSSRRYEAAYGRLPGHKRERVRAIQEQYWDKADALKEQTLGYLDPEEAEALAGWKLERREALARVLTPQELEDFDLETSRVAVRLRLELKGFDPSAEEFRVLFRLLQGADGEHPAAGGQSSLASDAAGLEWNETVEQKVKAALGASRYDQLQQSRTQEFRNLVRITEESGLPQDRAVEAYELQMDSQEEVLRLQTAPGLSEAERQEGLSTLRIEVEEALQEILGETGAEKLKRSGALPVLLEGNRERSAP